MSVASCFSRPRSFSRLPKPSFDQAKELIEQARDEEQEYLDNMPESLQQAERGERAQAAVEALDEAYNSLDELDLEGVISSLGTAAE